MQRGPGMDGDLGPLARKATTTEAPNVRGHAGPNEAAFDVGHGGVGTRVRQTMDTVEDALNPGARNDRAIDPATANGTK